MSPTHRALMSLQARCWAAPLVAIATGAAVFSASAVQAQPATPTPSAQTTSTPQTQQVTPTPQAQPAQQTQQAQRTILQAVQNDARFSTLAQAVQAAGLGETLSGAGPFTVFAPTNAAFDKLPSGTLNTLLNNPQQLRAVLTNHVVQGRVTSADLPGRPSATSVQGSALNFSTNPARVNSAAITEADLQASNGVIHVIDTVLVPQGVQIGSAGAQAGEGQQGAQNPAAQAGEGTAGAQAAPGRSGGIGPIAAAATLGGLGLAFGAGGFALRRRNQR